MEVQNPIRLIRESQGLTLRKAAEKIDCNYQTLYMIEHGMYLTVLPKVLDWAIKFTDSDKSKIEYNYMLFRTEKQDLAKEKYSLNSIKVDSLGIPGDHPILSFRMFLGLTQSAFCKELCIPVALLYYSETVAVSLPKKLRNMFYDLGVPGNVVDEIVCRYELIER